MSDIHLGPTCQLSKGNFATRTTNKVWHFLNGILIRKDTDKIRQKIPFWNLLISSMRFSKSNFKPSFDSNFHFGIYCFILRSFASWCVGVSCLLILIPHWSRKLFRKNLLKRHLTMSLSVTYYLIFRWKKFHKSCRREKKKTTFTNVTRKKGSPEGEGEACQEY